MSTTSCDTVRESAPDFALGALTGRERAEVVAHLDDCPACQALVGEYASVADTLLELIPEAEPTAKLASPVLAAMRPSPLPRWRRPHRRQHRRRGVGGRLGPPGQPQEGGGAGRGPAVAGPAGPAAVGAGAPLR